jgi:type IV secretory pathway VirB9-like protein
VAYAAREEAGYLDIGPGTTLTVIADGRTLKFHGIGSANLRKNKKGVLTENAIYLASAEDLRAIANAQRVAVRVAGKNGQLERDFAPANFERFRQFTSKFVSAPK